MQLFDAFISYGRADSKAFAIKLQSRLEEQGFQVWFDFNDIPLGVDFQHQIDDGIEKARQFLFIIAPHSVNSPYCGKEIELAINCHKRIIPLLHVEQISRETWQQRNPHGTAQDWEAYKAKGLHSSFPNMHPTISKINWVYFREGRDDFDKSLGDLIKLLRSHTDYVDQHTQFLVKALEWERQQKQTSYLLTGEERQQATSWLKIRFKEEQPPCTPSDLHCEYITESIKNGNNLMTEVFLCYSDQDRGIMEKIRNSLRRESITVWTNLTDIQTGEDFGEAINRGIEQADNLVFLLSPESINSTYCQQELDLALSLNKRIIPVLVRETESNLIPKALRELQYIDLTNNVKQNDYLLDESQLLKILHQDEAYYHKHKMLLTKALKWQRQHENPSILLRGYNLRSAETWLKVAQKRKQHPPTSLQEKFITESLRQPPLESLDVFISYSRADSDLGRKLNDSLQMQGKTTWFDQESIASGSDFQQEINRGIKACDNFLFILSPRSVNSPYCKDEVEYAASLNKRFVTVLHRQVNPADLHPELAKVQWIDFNKQDFNANFNELVRTLDVDREYVRSHTKWLQRAIEWEQEDKSKDLLLRGSEFAVAQDWLETALAKKKQPVPTALQQTFTQESHQAIVAAEEAEKTRQAELLRLQEEKTKEAEARLAQQQKSARLQKLFLVVVSVGFVASLVLAGIAGFSFLEAVEKREEAQQSKGKAQISSTEAQAKSSEALYTSNHKLEALLKALQAEQTLHKVNQEANAGTNKLLKPLLQMLPGKQVLQNLNQDTSADKQAVEAALQQAVFGVREYNRLSGHQATVLAVAISPDGQLIASGSEDNTIKLWNREGKLEKNLEGHKQSVNAVAFSPDGKQIASASVDKTIKLWGSDGTFIKTLEGHSNAVRDVAFRADGKLIASASDDKTIKLWQPDGTLINTLEGHTDQVTSVAFSPDGKLIASASDDQTIKLWQPDGTLIQTLEGHKDNVESVAFSPDGKLIASTSSDNTIKLWNRDGTLSRTLTGHKDIVLAVAFSDDGNRIASASYDKTIKVWKPDGTLLANLTGHSDHVTGVTFEPKSYNTASASADNTVRLWKLDQNANAPQILYGHQDVVKAVTFSPDGKLIASAGDDKKVKLWNQENLWQQTLSVDGEVRGIAFSPNNKFIAAALRNKTIKLWQQDGTPLKRIPEQDKVNQVAFSPDSKVIASASDDYTVKLWPVDGGEGKVLRGHEDKVKSVAFSPDGKLIVSGSSDNSIRLWSPTGQQLSKLTRHKGAVNDVSFSPDGTMIASASADNTVKLWQRDRVLLTLVHDLGNLEDKHTESVNQVVFSPDGELIASASVDKTVKLWNLKGKLLGTFYLHTDAVNGVAFWRDSKTVVSASSDHTVILWNVDEVQKTGELQTKGCNWLEDYLETNTDWKKRDRNLCQ
ncbi:MAG: TIR domain-containing protein [Symploca sp. SIO2E6]|nr:TIR domain-containing protein [Symploca sp. SIO2E6]